MKITHKKKTGFRSDLYRRSTYVALCCLISASLYSLVLYERKNDSIYLLSFLTTFIASCFYSIFVMNGNVMVQLRYLDWVVTTPILLYELCLLTNIESFPIISSILILNLLVFVFGYLGERRIVSRLYGCFFGFLPFLFLFYLIFQNGTYSHFIPYFFILWTFYGLTYLIPNVTKRNILYNVLDIFSKAVFAFLL